jgi:hypothetical protein
MQIQMWLTSLSATRVQERAVASEPVAFGRSRLIVVVVGDIDLAPRRWPLGQRCFVLSKRRFLSYLWRP